MQMKDKVAIVTGGAAGIGEAVVRRYLKEGANVVVVDVKPASELEATYADAAKEQLLLLQADVTKRDGIEAIVRSTLERFGRIDVLFNNAAVFDMRPILDESWDIFDRLFSVNVKGMFFLMQRVAQQMVDQGGGGKIINMASQAGRRGEALVAHYCASKAAVISYTQSAALALAAHRINVNGIAPGVIDTPMWKEVDALFLVTKTGRLVKKSALLERRSRLGAWDGPTS